MEYSFSIALIFQLTLKVLNRDKVDNMQITFINFNL